jgi:hypothetical protein
MIEITFQNHKKRRCKRVQNKRDFATNPRKTSKTVILKIQKSEKNGQKTVKNA